MARISATFDAEDEIESSDFPSDRFGRIASLSFDGVDLYLTNPSPVEGKDARIAATCNRLIGVLVELRDAAEARKAGEAVEA